MRFVLVGFRKRKRKKWAVRAFVDYNGTAVYVYFGRSSHRRQWSIAWALERSASIWAASRFVA